MHMMNRTIRDWCTKNTDYWPFMHVRVNSLQHDKIITLVRSCQPFSLDLDKIEAIPSVALWDMREATLLTHKRTLKYG